MLKAFFMRPYLKLYKYLSLFFSAVFSTLEFCSNNYINKYCVLSFLLTFISKSYEMYYLCINVLISKFICQREYNCHESACFVWLLRKGVDWEDAFL